MGDNLNSEISDYVIAEAENGSAKHQLQLALHYLKLAELNISREENGSKAVRWLIAASKQGSVEATESLKHCAETDLGMDDKNKADVKWCINTSASEKKIRYAAKSLFAKLNAAHKMSLSKDEYVEAINTLTTGNEKEKKLLIAAGRKIGNTITENDFIKTLSKKIHGTLTLTSVELDERSAAYDSSSALTKVLKYPRQTAVLMFDTVLEYSSKEGLNIIMSLIPTNQIYLLLMLFAYSFLTPSFFLFIVPLLVFYISLLIMIVSTLQMFYKKRKQKEATTLVSLLQEQFDVDIDVESTESQYSWNTLTPYFVYFIALPIMVASFSIGNKSYIPCGELFIISLIMTGFCFLGLNDSYDLPTLLALAAHVFASLPVFLQHVPKIPVISAVLGCIANPFLSVDLGLNISFNLGLPSIVQMIIPVILFGMAMRNSWSGIYKILIPHLVCYFWFSVSITTFPLTTWVSLARATLGYLLLPVVVPLSVFLFVIGFFYGGYKLLQTDVVGKLLITVVLFAIPLLLTQSKSLMSKKDKNVSPKSEKFKKILMISFAVLGVVPLLFVRLPSVSEKKTFELTWDDYKSLCIPKGDIWAPYQIRCRDFIGIKIKWKGIVDQVKVTKVENTAENVIKSLPSVFSDPLYCIYGDKIPDCDEETMSKISFKHCQLVKSTGRTCHLSNQNQAVFTLSVRVEETVLNLEAGANFHGRLLALKPGDEVDFSGILSDVGALSPQLKLKSLNCTSRELPVMMGIENDVDDKTLFMLLNEALALAFNFGLFPVLTYTP